ncbi:beta-mannosidase [Cantharellus anzutake]|uniref:beta-mannosidase n=1 Tax=Cantharellus anzutake TaxID=1750568 RepID=UPI001906CBA1|nr:beta-mannosidase [Cantharellus anzutake]KAF8325256.1 beta-mannosidase [Cantharellus anzutake]
MAIFPSQRVPIIQGWEFTQLGGGPENADGEWLPVSKVPTVVQAELLKLKKIPDPHIGLNEYDVQWVGEADWAFRTEFGADDHQLDREHVDLVLEGLDTYATVQLNGVKILSANNMFVEYRCPIKKYMKQGKNTLVIVFPSTFLKGRELQDQHGKLACWNGDPSRLHVRKAQYHYGWDWGPVLLTVGPWKPICLHSYTWCLEEVNIASTVASDLSVAFTVHAKATKSAVASSLQARVSICGSPQPLAFRQRTSSLDAEGKSSVCFSASPKELELWWPLGYGKQNLYTISVELLAEDGRTVIDTATVRVGFRRVEVVQDPLESEEGRTFYFRINNIPIFCGGSNWIPADNFLTEISPDRYRKWLQLLVDGNQNMVRVWGGGIYESDDFYSICDELGIMVWQDFLFGCGQYPAYDEILDQVKMEAEQAVKRLRHHPSLVIFAGNNEDYQLAESNNLELDYSDDPPESDTDYRKTNFPARHIYERVLPEIVERLSGVQYHRGSPYSGFGKLTTDQKYGDLHQWNVWHGSQEPWNNWDVLSGRFVSEFGMQGYPDRRTVDYWTGGDKEERYPQSRVTGSHNKAAGFERRLELYLVENFRHSFDMDSYIYYTQVMQAETLASAYRLWRRNWKGPGREYTAGALVWQLNDCWPVTSWAIVDYFLRPKPSYFAVKRELAAFTVGITRNEVKTTPNDKPNSIAYFEIDTKVEIWGTNSTLAPEELELLVEAFDLNDRSFNWKEERAVKLSPNSSTELWTGQVPGQQIRTKLSEVPRPIVISARLMRSGEVVGRCANWPEPFKFLKFPHPSELGLKIVASENTSGDITSVRLSTSVPIKAIVLDADGSQDVSWSDQFIDLIPGDDQIIEAKELNSRKITVRFLGDGSV